MSRKDNFKLYRVWDGIIQLFYNPKAKNYHNYGGSSFCDCMYDQCAWWCGDAAECCIQLLVRVLGIGK